jgi:hypothetical protein
MFRDQVAERTLKRLSLPILNPKALGKPLLLPASVTFDITGERECLVREHFALGRLSVRSTFHGL